MRTAFLLVLFAGAALVFSRGQAPAALLGPPPILAKSYYVVRPDPRACPSPVCGGYWVSLANHARTRCADGLRRPRCYAAELVDAETRQPTPVAAGALVKAALGSKAFGGFGSLGILSVTETWLPVDGAPAAGDFFRLRDTGARCIRAPCFSIRVGRVNIAAHTRLVSALDLGPADTGAPRRKARAALASDEGLLAAGRIVTASNGGRLFRASQVYLRPSPPRD